MSISDDNNDDDDDKCSISYNNYIFEEENFKNKDLNKLNHMDNSNKNSNNNNNYYYSNSNDDADKSNRININIDSFQNILIKLHKQNISKLLNKDIILMEEIYLINTLEIINIIFEFFQIQDVYKLIHRSLLLRIMDYFFYLINKNIHNFIYEKKKINELERNHLYENFVLIQNKISFVMINCIGTIN
ncbi:hypothetical protein PFHG_05563 [Plasmodium falciparum HB3]|uniref:Uncharacterized protein n=1 Tax=Plasmodium falciparum (isolate HB3) TaxID=137071 RepID=A0A0L7KM98_PLAFX|nr:hypothetical protein PFHG_05563 [Plasmodium falciparum HB3]